MECIPLRADQPGWLFASEHQPRRTGNRGQVDAESLGDRDSSNFKHTGKISIRRSRRVLYEFAWDDFCSYYVEMLKDRFQDESKKGLAQSMLAHVLDSMLRLLAPIMPFVAEEIWGLLNQLAPERGLEKVEPATQSITVAAWPEADTSAFDVAIEKQFLLFQKVLTAVRNIRSQQNIPPKETV